MLLPFGERVFRRRAEVFIDFGLKDTVFHLVTSVMLSVRMERVLFRTGEFLDWFKTG